MKAYTAKQYALAFYESIQNKTKSEVAQATDNLIAILKKNHRLGLAKKVIKEFEEITLRKAGVMVGVFWSAHKMNEDIIKSVADRIAAKLGDKNIKQISLREQTDKNIIGGFKVRMADVLMDASILGGLQKVKKELKNI